MGGYRETCARPVTVRALSREEIEALGADDEVYVPSSDFYSHTGLVERAHLAVDRTRTHSHDKYAYVRTIYGHEYSVGLDEVYVPVEDGEEKWLMKTAGARVSTSLFFPDMDEGEAIERLYKAIRNEFGAGVVERWNQRSSPVRDVRRDVYEVRRDLVEVERAPYRVGSEPKGGRGRKEYVEVERNLLARGVRDGREDYYRGQVREGWSFHAELHNPEVTAADTI
jgi:hypothetical protein